jgi:hypothetical protein
VISLLFLSAVARGPGDAEIVYSARFYKQGAAKSYYQIYLSGIDGKGKRCFDRDGRDCFVPIWVDRDHVAYFEVSPSFRARGYLDLPVLGEFRVLDVRNGRSKVVGKAKIGRWPDSDANQGLMGVGGAVYRFDLNSVHRVDEEIVNIDVGLQSQTENDEEVEKLVTRVERNGYSFEFRWLLSYTEEVFSKFPIEVKVGNSWQTYELCGGELVDVIPISDSRFYAITRTGFHKFYWADTLYDIDIKSQLARKVLGGVSALRFSPEHSYYGGNATNPRILEKLDDGRAVWTNWLYTGNWETGERWAITDKLVSVDSYAIWEGK